MAYEVKINISVRELESSCNSPDLSQEVCFQIGESEYSGPEKFCPLV